MLAADLIAQLTTLTTTDPQACNRAELAQSMTAVHAIRGFLDSFEAGVARRTVELGDPAAMLLRDGGRRPVRDTEAAAARGALCADMPELGSALTDGRMSAGHVDAVARVVARLDDSIRAELVGMAPVVVASAEAASSTETFERQIRDLGRRLSRDDGVEAHERLRRQRSVKRWIDRHTGMHLTQIALDPEADARLSAALDAAVAAERAKPDDSRTFDQLKADALMHLVIGPGRGTCRPAELTMLIDYETMQHGIHATSVCETGDGAPLPPETVRRLACEAEIVPVVLSSDGVVLDVGRASRIATHDQRKALRAMYRTCGHPECEVRFADCDVHHVIPWNRAGPTDVANLLPLCSQHHHEVHEGGWQLTLQPDRRVMLRRPDGTIHHDATTVNATGPPIPLSA
jgi:hypothetical protein